MTSRAENGSGSTPFSLAVKPSCCPKCGAPEGEPHRQCSSPYLVYSASKARTMTKDNIRPVNSLA